MIKNISAGLSGYLYSRKLFLFIFILLMLPRFSWSQQKFSLIEQQGKMSVLLILNKNDIFLFKNPSQQKEDVFKVFVGKKVTLTRSEKQPIIGEYYFKNDSLIFTPAFAFQANTNYTAFIGHPTISSFEFKIAPPQNNELAIVENIYPSTDTLAANQLKFYIYFSRPMQEGQAYQQIEIWDEQNQPLSQPFVPLKPELWDSNYQRLTLWLDPGRIKRALGPNEGLGAPLEAGKRYTLLIKKDWKDQTGQTLRKESRKIFYVSAADRKKPDIRQWQVKIPQKNTKDPLSVIFDESLDQVLALKSIQVLDKHREIMKGEIQLGAKEQNWIFSPHEPWQAGKYLLRIEAKLEDLAANNLNRLFDRDLEDHRQTISNKKFYWIEFGISP